MFDFVVVGRRFRRRALAGRLSEDAGTGRSCSMPAARRQLRVTTPGAIIPMVSASQQLAFDTVPQKTYCKVVISPRGSNFGGSSVINAMVYIRGHRADYDPLGPRSAILAGAWR